MKVPLCLQLEFIDECLSRLDVGLGEAPDPVHAVGHE